MTTTTAGHPPPAPIRAPANFPVRWERPGDERLLWAFDRMHFPDPLTPVDAWYFRAAYASMNVPAREYAYAFRIRARVINTYAYAAVVPLAAAPGAPPAQADRGPKPPHPVAARLRAAWDTEFLPEIKRYLADCEAFDRAGAPLPALAAHFASAVAGMERLWDIHMLVMFPAYTAISQFADLYRDLFGPDRGPRAAPGAPFGAYRLLQGFDNKTLEANRALWAVSRRALAAPAVRRALAASPAAGVPAALEACAGGPAVLGELRAFLRAYGERGDKWGLSGPYWIEDPSPVIANLRDYVAQPDRDPAAERAALAAEREHLLARARARLRGRPRPVVEAFEGLLRAAQEATVLTEDHGFWIDSRGGYQVRRVLLELGRRFAAAGALAAPDEVFLLTVDEVRETAAAAAKRDRRRLVAGRLAELAYFRTIAPPPALGTPSPAGAPPDDPVLRMLGRFFGAPSAAAARADVVRGNAGAPGVARGPARVLRSLTEAAKLRPGDVLVAPTTAPAWTGLFATAAAIVTDAGGILSHCAVVAREYGIPAVVGTGTATAVIEDGRWLEVDGDAGVVRLL